MATIPSKTSVEEAAALTAASLPAWPTGVSSPSPALGGSGQNGSREIYPSHSDTAKPSQRDALQALLAFAALHDQVRRRKALAARHAGFDAGARRLEFEEGEQFVLDEVLQLVAERGVAITGADGLAIALAENDEIVLRASAGTVRPDVGARIDRDSAFSGASFRAAEIVICDDTETDVRVNLEACRRLGARSMVAVPLCGRRRVIGLLEAFSSWPFSFNDSDVRNLSLLAELVVSALKPEDEDRFAESAQIAETKLAEANAGVAAPPMVVPVAAAPFFALRATAAPSSASVEPVAPAEAKPGELPGFATLLASSATALPAAATPSPEVVSAAAVASVSKTAEVPGPAFVAEAGPEPVFTFGLNPERAPHRSGASILLICIVVGAAFGAGVWWKLKTAQLGRMIIRTERASNREASQAATPAPTAATGVNAANAPDASEMNSDSPGFTSPASSQDLAKFPRVTGIRHWSSADSTSVAIDLEDQVQYEALRLTNPDRIYFDLHDTQLAPELTGKAIEVGDPLLNRIRVAQPVAGTTRVVLETRGDWNVSVSLEPNPYRIVAEVRKLGASARNTVNLFPNAEAERNRLAIVVPPPTREDLLLRARLPKMRIVVDAGHGGWDLGTVGRRGLLEKDLVLEIAERLGKLLESRLGTEVVYTRTDDNYIPLDDRAAIANRAQADLFVSVHANYSDLPSARGVETYYTNSFSAPGAKDAGARQISPNDVGLHPVSTASSAATTPTLSAADLHERVEQSRRLATSVQRSLYGALAVQNPGLRDRGIKEAGFVVLTESSMPGILAEVSFVSSPTDEQKLRSDGYREQIAEALYKGIARYAANFRAVKVAAKQSPVVSSQ